MTEILNGFKKYPRLYVIFFAMIILIIGINEVLSFSSFILNKNWFANSLICILLIAIISMYLLKIKIWR